MVNKDLTTSEKQAIFNRVLALVLPDSNEKDRREKSS